MDVTCLAVYVAARQTFLAACQLLRARKSVYKISFNGDTTSITLIAKCCGMNCFHAFRGSSDMAASCCDDLAREAVKHIRGKGLASEQWQLRVCVKTQDQPMVPNCARMVPFSHGSELFVGVEKHRGVRDIWLQLRVLTAVLPNAPRRIYRPLQVFF